MIRTLLFIAALLCAAPAFALDTRDSAFAALPVLHEGRIKPMDSFARAMHWRITGRQKPGGTSAAQWLAEVLFDPLAAAERPQFTVRNPELVALLALPARRGGRYSFTEISAGMAPHIATIGALANEEDLSPAQEDLLALQGAVIDFTQLMRSLSLMMPLAVGWPDADGRDFMALQKHERAAQEKLAAIMKRKGDDIEKFTADERQVAAFVYQLDVVRGAAEGNALLRVIPAAWSADGWLSPWMAAQSGQGGPDAAIHMQRWRDMVKAWQAGDENAFAAAAGKPDMTARQRAEMIYNATAPFGWAMAAWAMACVLALAALSRPHFTCPACAAALAGIVAATAGLVLRVYILERPPVGTLYESLLFVALVVGAAGLAAGRKDPAVLAAGTAGAAALLGLAPLLIRSGDALPVLVAVLNTNFWLATHVIVITAGYGFAILCGMAAHIWLAGAALNRPQSILTAHRLALAALLFTTVGTILGGIWADQSWGRFWGWDPKENGALLIVLWLVWALHGRRAGYMPPALYAAALAAVNVVVALAWFGVNLLSVGLHSYGFTSGIAGALAAFCAAEAAIIGALYYAPYRRGRKHEA